jgi:hypothetical protein
MIFFVCVKECKNMSFLWGEGEGERKGGLGFKCFCKRPIKMAHCKKKLSKENLIIFWGVI